MDAYCNKNHNGFTAPANDRGNHAYSELCGVVDPVYKMVRGFLKGGEECESA